MKIQEEVVRDKIIGLYVRAGLAKQDAVYVAESLVMAEKRGVVSHGIILTETYLHRILKGGIKRKFSLEHSRVSGNCLSFDGGGGPGQAVLMKAIKTCLKKYPDDRSMIVTVVNSNHIGMLCYFTRYLAKKGYVALLLTNAGPSVSNGVLTEAVIGNNAVSLAVPTNGSPLVVDMAIGSVACGKIRHDHLTNKKSKQCIVVEDGSLSHDPVEFLNGAPITPFGGYKGFALGIIIDILTGVLTGSKTSNQLIRQREALASSNESSQFLLILKKDSFAAEAEFEGSLNSYLAHFASRFEGVSNCHIPGELEDACEKRNGNFIEIEDCIYKDFVKVTDYEG